ncbi:xanthine dehydrogenase family protein molybdopterin-binding subunit, partial [Pseudactinotalea sp.]|uniref:xanthine dehydrogenase family protein molybdopterin-binding subunit n=1 Tax=Pseudactinotalea sp. TaxID=1926260 RepID=UPI003B3AC4C3
NLLASSHARDQRIQLRVAADADGRIRALEADVLSDMGAYGVDAHGPLLEVGGTSSMIPGPYDIQAYRYRARAVATNKTPLGAYRGVGLPMAVFAHERAMDIVAGELGLDRAEVRRRNLVRTDQLPYETTTGRTYDNGDYHRALELALDRAGYDEAMTRRHEANERGKLAGLGIASFVEYTGMNRKEYQNRGMLASTGRDTALIELDGEGRASVWVTMPSVGQGILTTFTQIAAAGLGLPLKAVTVMPTDTAARDLIGQGTGASRGMAVGGNAVHNAARELNRRICADAAEQLGLEHEEVELREGRFVSSAGATLALGLADLIARQPAGSYQETATYESTAVSYSYATHVCTVEIDPVTGEIEVLTYVVADDCGRVINPMIVHGQARGGVVQGIGVALYERHQYDKNGQLQTSSLMDYLIPTATDVPNITIESFEMPTPASVLGAKGMGESGTLGPPAAIANAVADALGAEVNELPITPSLVRSVLRERYLEGSAT